MRFWRALETLFGVENCDIQPCLIIEKYDVYSFIWICNEILINKISLKILKPNDYNDVLKGANSFYSKEHKIGFKCNILNRCWHSDRLSIISLF